MHREVVWIYLDESHFHRDMDLGYSWGRVGERLGKVSGCGPLSDRMNWFGAYNFSDGQCLSWAEGSCNKETTAEFLRRIKEWVGNVGVAGREFRHHVRHVGGGEDHGERQIVPGDAGLEDEEDAGENAATIERPAAGKAEPPRFLRWQQRLDAVRFLVYSETIGNVTQASYTSSSSRFASPAFCMMNS